MQTFIRMLLIPVVFSGNPRSVDSSDNTACRGDGLLHRLYAPQRLIHIRVPEGEPRRLQPRGEDSLAPEQELVGAGADEGAEHEGRGGGGRGRGRRWLWVTRRPAGWRASCASSRGGAGG